ncbi:MAG: NADH:ubiquinone reductase (Na(+)-transporting) subunit B [Myxococcales bacterium]|nr:NADH:ubiquinone reductase (Na(+)-transporting) subunit B [Myxococcales bacterium]
MKFLRSLLDKLEKPFSKGQPLEKLYPVYEMHDTILYTPGQVTQGNTHVRDALDLKRMMITVVIALLPCFLMAFYNTGYQANLAIAKYGAKPLAVWQTQIFQWLGFVPGSMKFLAHVVYGGLFFLPVLITTFAVGGIIEVTNSIVRGHEVNEGFLVTGFLLPLTLPPTIPLWQVGMGAAFGVLIGKEIFGGTGKNILNPALTGRAFLFFAYPAQISGDKPWIAADFAVSKFSSTLPDAVSGATWLGKAAADKAALAGHGLGSQAWWDAFLGFVPGSMGETSALACLIGAAILIYTQIGSWRTMAGVVLGTFATVSLLGMSSSTTNPMFAVPFYWHVVLGGWAFGMVFMATDPVSSAFTDLGKWIYGFLIGVMVILVRVVNPAYPEGMMLAILFMNMFAPLVDHFVVQANIKRRLSRHAV